MEVHSRKWHFSNIDVSLTAFYLFSFGAQDMGMKLITLIQGEEFMSLVPVLSTEVNE